MLNSAQHKMIGRVLEMLESFTDEDFENSRFYIDVKLQDRFGEYKVEFEDEAGDWTYRVEQL